MPADSGSGVWYVLVAIIIVFVIFLIWVMRGDINFVLFRPKIKANVNMTVLVRTKDGVFSMDKKAVRTSLKDVREGLEASAVAATRGVEIPDAKKKIANLTKSLRDFIKKYPDSAVAACKVVRSDDASNYMNQAIDPTFAYVKGYAAVLQTEEIERNLVELQEPKALFSYLLQNFDLIIQLLAVDVCPDGVLDLERLEEYLLDINKEIEGLQKEYENGIQTAENHIPERLKLRLPTDLLKKPATFANDIDRTLDAHGESTGVAPYAEKNLWFKSRQMIEPFDSRPYLPRARPQIHKFVGFEESIDKDLLGYKPPGHFIRSLNDHHEYYTVDVNACLGHYVPDEWYGKECGGDTRGMMAALDGNPFPMLDGWVVDN